MACKFEEPEFWLPSEFLTDDEILMGHGNLKKTEGHRNDFSDLNLCFPTDFPYDFCPTVLGSPVDSFAGSTETESDEEDALAGLTRQLTRTTLNSNLSQHQIEKNWVHSGSPQSTLAQIGSWSVRSSGSSDGSPNGLSQVSSPPTSPLGAQNDAWNLIYQAAGQVARMKMHGWFRPTRNQGLPGPPRSVHHPVHTSAPMKSPNSSFSNNTHLEQARREQMARQQSSAMLNRQVKNGWFNEQPVCQNRGLRSGFGVGGFVESNRCGRVVGDSGQTGWSALPFEQQNHYQGQSGSGMRAGHMGGSGNCGVVKKRECAGTGVFLPRRYCSQNSTDSRKKPGCSTAWLPARVVESLNKNIDGLNGIPSQHQHQPHALPQPPRFNSEYEIIMARRNALLAQQRRNLQQEGTMNLEVRLPQEWTY
ncbi:uncharacterized protein [Nicotiana sylvestris]|uniref:Uncharacterized protein LOC104211519 n=1 Tax=Nicotiana sylvestris TaxID=4096 RepID=A0A1U7V9C9_NICSY|nr:PREDICTED: uncharacterized protein LOC104211519 [Nicotiana sylvestris]